MVTPNDVAAGRGGIPLRLMPTDASDGQPVDRTPYQLSIEVLNGQMTEARAKRESAAIFHIALEVLRGLRIEQCVMWNGQQLVCRAVRQACTVQGVATRFIEISNLPGKLFVDSLGVNALSTISRYPEVIDRLPLPDEDTHARWLSTYERDKRKPLPQARTSFGRKATSATNYVLKLVSRGVGRRRLASVRAQRHAGAAPGHLYVARHAVDLPLCIPAASGGRRYADQAAL